MKFTFYDIASIGKILLWLTIVLIIYTQINIYEDPVVGLLFGFLGIFIFAWWLSYFIFYFSQKLIKPQTSQERLLKDSYKLSLLFWIYALMNLILISWDYRNRVLGLVILIIFVLLQIILLKNTNENE